MSFVGSVAGSRWVPKLGMGAAVVGSGGVLGTTSGGKGAWQRLGSGGKGANLGPGSDKSALFKWPKKEDMPVKPLDPEREMGILTLLEEAGGVLPLGRVTEKFPGLKRKQLEGIFELNPVGSDGQFEVRIPGCEFTGAEIMFQGQPLSKDQQLPDLDLESIARVRTALEQEPGFTLMLSKVRELVPGVNKKQLEKSFQVVRVDKKHFNITLGPPGEVRLADQQGPGSGGSGSLQGAKRPHLSFQPPGPGWLASPLPTPLTKWPKKEDMPGKPLDPEREMGILKLLEEAGGVLPLGRVTEQFPGLKRKQLEGIFELNPVGNDGQFEVRIPGCEVTGAEIMFQGQPLTKDQQLPDLDLESIARVRTALEQTPDFTLMFSKVRELVPGVNKKQLEKDFEVVRVNKKHFNIALKQGERLGVLPAAKRLRMS